MNVSQSQIVTLITVCTAVLTAAVGLLGYFVGRQQAKTERLRFRHELYDRRLKTFRATMVLCVHVMREANIQFSEIMEFNVATNESYFLFGDQIHNYLYELYCKAVDLNSIREQLNSGEAQDEQRKELVRQSTELLKWFAQQPEVARKKFAKHMALQE